MKIYVELKKDEFPDVLSEKDVQDIKERRTYTIEDPCISDYIQRSQKETPGFLVMKNSLTGKEIAFSYDEVSVMTEGDDRG